MTTTTIIKEQKGVSREGYHFLMGEKGIGEKLAERGDSMVDGLCHHLCAYCWGFMVSLLDGNWLRVTRDV